MSSFRNDFLKAILYTSASKYTGLVISTLITMVLARLLTPEDFGVVALAYVIINFVNMLTDLGLGPAIIQTELDKKDEGSLFSFTFIIGLVAAIILLLAASPISNYYENEKLRSVISLLSVNVLLISLATVPYALLIKQKKFKVIAIRTLVTQLIAGFIAVLLAICGYGVYSLVWQYIILAAIGLAINLYFEPIKLFVPIYKNTVNKILRFSAYQFLTSLMHFISKDIDKLIIGHYFKLHDLGYYEKSYRLMQLPVGNLTSVFTPVIQPIFKEYKNDRKHMLDKYLRMLKYLAVISFPISIFLFFEAQDIIVLFYGKQWEPAISPFRYLSIGIGFQILIMTATPICQAAGQVKTMLYINILDGIITILTITIGVYLKNLNVLAISISVGIIIKFAIIFIYILAKVFNSAVRAFFKSIAVGIITSTLCLIQLLFLLQLWTDDYSLMRLVVSGFTIIITILLVMQKTQMFDIKTLIKNKLNTKQ